MSVYTLEFETATSFGKMLVTGLDGLFNKVKSRNIESTDISQYARQLTILCKMVKSKSLWCKLDDLFVDIDIRSGIVCLTLTPISKDSFLPTPPPKRPEQNNIVTVKLT